MARKTVTTDFQVFSQRLSLLMKERKLKQQDLADFLCIKRQTVSLYMTGQSMPDAGQLKNIAIFFGVSADWLLGLSEVKTIDADIKQVCAYTGLSPEAVNVLAEMSKQKDALQYQLYLLNAILTHPSLYTILFDMSEIQLIADSQRKYPDVMPRRTPSLGASSLKAARAIKGAFSAAKEVYGEDFDPISNEDRMNFALFVAQQHFGKVLESVASMPPFWQLNDN